MNNRAAIDALDDSIEKYTDIVNRIKMHSGYCSLCNLYRAYGCVGCPISKDTKAIRCQGTPYMAIQYYASKRSNISLDDDFFIKLCDLFLHYLTDLRMRITLKENYHGL